MKLKDVTEAYLEDLLQNGDDYTLVGEYIDFIREVKRIIHTAITDMSGCVTDKDVEYQYLGALNNIEDMEI